MKRGNRRLVLVLLPVLIILASAVYAVAGGEKVDETRKASGDCDVTISNVSGSVHLIGWGKNEVKVTGTLGEGTKRLDIEGDEDHWVIKVVLPKFSRDVEDTDLEIHVPKGSRIDLSTVSADIQIEKLEGDVNAQSVSGELVCEGKMKEMVAETVSGNIRLVVDADRMEAESVSGTIEISDARGEVYTNTVSGTVTLVGNNLGRFQSSTVSGDILFTAGLEKSGSYHFESHSGDVILNLSGKVNAEFDVETFSGDIENDFGNNGKRTSKYAPGRELYFTVGSGDAEIQIETFSGDVEIGKK